MRPRLRLVLSCLLAGAAVLSGGPASAERVPRPVLTSDFADPAVTAHGDGFVAFSTGSLVPRSHTDRPAAPWHGTGAALVRLPTWSHAHGDVWASDIARVDGWWVDTPAAEDPVPIAVAGLPRAGVIDPSLVIADGEPHLVYKTDRIPSSIRLLPLSASGLHAAGPSVELFRYDGVLENPVLIERPAGWVMLLSQGDFTHCSYRTIWRRTTNVLDWTSATSGVLLDRKSRLCGPGGADVTFMPHSKHLRVYFHAWTCHRSTTPCRPGIRKDKVRHRSRAVRPMYGADLDWVDGVPVVAGFL